MVVEIRGDVKSEVMSIHSIQSLLVLIDMATFGDATKDCSAALYVRFLDLCFTISSAAILFLIVIQRPVTLRRK